MDINRLLDDERQELLTLFSAWQHHRARRDYALADLLRARLLEWDSWGGFIQDDRRVGYLTQWHPYSETDAHRAERVRERLMRYNPVCERMTGPGGFWTRGEMLTGHEILLQYFGEAVD